MTSLMIFCKNKRDLGRQTDRSIDRHNVGINWRAIIKTGLLYRHMASKKSSDFQTGPKSIAGDQIHHKNRSLERFITAGVGKKGVLCD